MYRNDLAKMQLAQMPGEAANPSQYIPPTRRKILEQQRGLLQHQLAVIDKAIAALDAHPELEEFSEILAAAGV